MINNNFIYLLLLSIFEIFGDFTLENYAHTNNIASLFYGSSFYVGVVYFLIKSLKNSTILYVNGMWDGMSALLETIFALVILKETLNTPYQYIGIAMIVTGLFLMHHGGIKK